MSLGRDLLSEIEFGGSEHPLGMLGLSPEILHLELTNEELYAVSKRFAKSLLAQVHEDRVHLTPRTKHLQARFSQAMVALRDVDTFQRSLKELRVRSSRTHDELVHSREALRGMTERAKSAEIELNKKVGELGECRRFLRDMREEATGAHRNEEENVRQARGYAVAKVNKKYIRRLEALKRNRETVQEHRARVQRREQRQREREERIRVQIAGFRQKIKGLHENLNNHRAALTWLTENIPSPSHTPFPSTNHYRYR